MPVEFGSVGGIAATFTVVDEFSDALTRAEAMLRGAAKAAAAFQTPARRWSESAAKLGAAAMEASRGVNTLGGAVSRLGELARASLGTAADQAAILNRTMRRSADAIAPFRSATTAALTQWNKLDAAVERSAGLLETAGNKMAFAATSGRAMAAETAEIAASAQATAKAAAATAAAVNRIKPVRAQRLLMAPEGGGTMPPIRPPRSRGRRGGGGGEDESFLESAGGYAAGRLKKVGSRVFSIPALGAGVTAYAALKAALATTYDVTKTAELYDVASIKNPTLLEKDKDTLLNLAFSSAQGTIFSAHETANAYGILAPILATAPAFQGPNKWKNFRDLAPIVLRASEVAAMNNLGPLKEDMIAMAWYAHLTGSYAPASMTASSNQLLALAERTGVSLPRLEKIESYALPVARGLGVNVSDAAMLVGALIQGGLGQRAGYAVGQMITGLLQTGGPVTAALQKALETLGTHGVVYKGKQLKAHQAGLHALGLLDQHGKLTVLDAHGNIDLKKVLVDIDAASKRLSPTAFGRALQAAFGVRGTRGAALVAALDKLLPAFDASVKNTPTALQQQAAFAATTQQQLQQVIARAKDIANILAISILPVLRGITERLLPILNDIDSYLGKHHRLSLLLTSTGSGAGIGGMIAGPPGAAIGAGVGLGIGMVGLGMQEWNSPLPPGGLPKAMPGAKKAESALLGIPVTNNFHITVNAPGADGHTIAGHVTTAIRNLSDQAKRQTFRDFGYATIGGAQ